MTATPTYSAPALNLEDPQGPLLNQPLTLQSGQTIANRLARSALSEALAEKSGLPGERLIRLYERWSIENSHGLIVTGNVMVDSRQLGEPGNVVAEEGMPIEPFQRWAAAGKKGGNKLWMQINHAGRQAGPHLTGNDPVAPSAIKTGLPGSQTPKELSEDEIYDIISRFATVAGIAKKAGFDGVQIHGAHGYLVSQFLSPLANQRSDQWGGSPENRMRFVVSVLQAMRNEVGPEFPIGIKLNSADFQKGGFSEQESMQVVKRLASEGIDMVEISGGTYNAPAMMGSAQRESTRKREAYFQAYAEEVRQLVPGLPLMLTGGFRTTEAMNGALEDGACDLIGIGRATCLNPDIGQQVLAQEIDHAPVGDRKVGLRPLMGRLIDIKSADGAIDLAWHSDQMQRMGSGKEPDPRLPWWRTLVNMLARHGMTAIKPKRGS